MIFYIHVCYLFYILLGAAGLIVGHPFDTTKVSSCEMRKKTAFSWILISIFLKVGEVGVISLRITFRTIIGLNNINKS